MQVVRRRLSWLVVTWLTVQLVAVVSAPIALKAGIPQKTLEELWSGVTPLDLDDDQQALYDLCRELHRDHHVTPATRARAIAALGEQGAMDAIGICGYYALLAMVLNSQPRVP